MMKETKELTAYGVAVRKYRMEAGVKLRQHAKYLEKSISLLSATEFGDKTVTDEILDKTIKFFATYSIDASDLIEKAKYSRRLYELNWQGFSLPDKLLFDCFATRLPNMTEEEKTKIMNLCRNKPAG